MHKTYYVQTGDVTEVLIAPSAKDAVRGAILRGCEKEQARGLLVSCNTIGFGEHPNEDMLFVTENELKVLGYDTRKFIQGFHLSSKQLMAYRKVKQAIEAFQALLTDDDLL